ncbi:response regulator transcription factor [Macrococcus armenti]|uniref:response regulator transcription factor n=1 Tax=Macrococcus armenti TaxID=2875764 RepID=UPI001CCC90F6|nr:response regulator transcription factor [Macrococcus armenti]UBH07573.1 response regulator transcription factor [Macrococcus armenti]UBH11971.1 response regulator transcription factor [Macrococcus armenti]UBH14349.1 response regulator transcription factor [Macrococcus armenti]UBH16709.1 response regulator transcription factor [Macrococcus armenti]UBH18972.1 response regulator transcription factor [Macrococcus armenti]
MKRILVVEDEVNLARFIELELVYEQYDVTVVYDGESGLNEALNGSYSCILLDLMLPKLSGLEVCKKIRSEKNTPIIMITAKGDTVDKVKGLDYGADDYIVKPFDIEELLARLRALLRRNQQEQDNILYIGELEINQEAFTVSFEGQPLELTKTEFELLRLLATNKNHVMTREMILTTIWGFDSEVETNVVDVYIRYLRNKLKPVGYHKRIETVRGVGYVIR